MRGLLRAVGVLLCMSAGVCSAAFAQDYNPNTGASTAPADGTLTAPASPNGVDWLNSMLGLSPAFLTSTGQVNGAYVNVDLSAYAKTAAVAATYLPLAGGTMTGAITGAKYLSATCLSSTALKAITPANSFAVACFFDSNNSNQPNLAVYALGNWHWLSLGSPL